METCIVSTLIFSLLVRRGICGDPCNGQCDINQICDNGDCVFLDKSTGEGPSELSPCFGVHCRFGTVCKGGECIKLELQTPLLKLSNCYGVSCPLDQVCIGGKCDYLDVVSVSHATGNPCICPFPFICNKKGECIELTIKAPDFLLDAELLTDTSSTRRPSSSCPSSMCTFPDVCDNGICRKLKFEAITDTTSSSGLPCFHIKCDKHEVCVDGECQTPTILANTEDDGIALSPCSGVRCPWGQLCVGGQCKELFIKAPELVDPNNRCNKVVCSPPNYCGVYAKCITPIFSGPNEFASDGCIENCASWGPGWVCRNGECVNIVSAQRELSKNDIDGSESSIPDCFGNCPPFHHCDENGDCKPLEIQCKCPNGDPCKENSRNPCGLSAKSEFINYNHNAPKPEGNNNDFNGNQVIITVFIGIIGIILSVSILLFASTMFMKSYSKTKTDKIVDMGFDSENQPLQ